MKRVTIHTSFAVALMMLCVTTFLGCGGNGGSDATLAAANTNAEVDVLDEKYAQSASDIEDEEEDFDREVEDLNPRAVADVTEFNFGEMEGGETGSQVFTIRNVGKGILTLEAGEPSCSSCTLFKIHKIELKPGEETLVTMEFDTTGKKGGYRLTAPALTNDPDNPEIEFAITGTLTELIRVFPDEIWRRPDYSGAKPLSIKGYIASSLLSEFKIINLVSTADTLTFDYELLSESDLKELDPTLICGYRINAMVRSDIPPGSYHENLTVEIEGTKTNDKKPRKLSQRIWVSVYRTGPVRVDGRYYDKDLSTLNMRGVDHKLGKKASLSMIIRQEERHEIKFLEIKSDNEAVKLEINPDPKFRGGGQRFFLNFEIPPGSLDSSLGAGRAKIVVKTDDPDPLIQTLEFHVKYQRE